jgi:hypothetical protein
MTVKPQARPVVFFRLLDSEDARRVRVENSLTHQLVDPGTFRE